MAHLQTMLLEQKKEVLPNSTKSSLLPYILEREHYQSMFCPCSTVLTSTLGHIWDVMLVWRKGNINSTVPVLHIVYNYNGAQLYEQFLQVSWLDQALIVLVQGLHQNDESKNTSHNAYNFRLDRRRYLSLLHQRPVNNSEVNVITDWSGCTRRHPEPLGRILLQQLCSKHPQYFHQNTSKVI